MMVGAYYIFPFDKVAQGSKIVIYGAGIVGYEYVCQIQATNWCDVLFIADKQNSRIPSLRGVDVRAPDKILGAECELLVVAARNPYLQSILSDLNKLGYPMEKIVYSESSCIPIKELFPKGDSLYGFISWAQHGDDFVILNIFKALGIEKPSYIDIGAHHPYEISNTALLYEMGSRGINIEANPNLIEAFYQNRPEDINLNIGISTKSGIIPFYMYDDTSGRNTFVEAETTAVTDSNDFLEIEKVVKLPVTTLSEIIDKHADGVYPDYMDIDIEGLDYDVLQTCDFSASKPLVINTEVRSKEETKKMTTMMCEKGYIPYCRMGENMIYIRNELRDAILS